MEDYLLLIDGSSLLSTQFFGNLPREILFAKTQEEKEAWYYKIMMTSKGVYTNGIFGFLRYLFKILKEQKPTYLAVAWDLTRDTFRRELYADYKGNRSETMKPLKEQFALCQEVLANMGVCQLMDSHFEADDFCGSMAKKFESQLPVKILTKDNDYLQLVTAQTTLWLMHSTADKTQELFDKYHLKREEMAVPDRVFPFTPELVKEEFGIEPCHVNSLKGLMGDKSDNITGVPGVGPASAVKLIQEYGTVGKLYEAIDHLDKAGEKAIKEYWKTKLDLKRSPLNFLLKESDTELVGRKAAFLSEQLATIKTDILIEEPLEHFRTHIDKAAAQKELDRLEFHSVHLDFDEEEAPSVFEELTIARIEDMNESFEVVCELKKEKTLGLSFAGTRSFFAGMAVAAGKKAYYFPVLNFITEDLLIGFANELAASCEKLYVPDAKLFLHHTTDAFANQAVNQSANNQIANQATEGADASTYPSLRDVSIGAYLLDPLTGSYPIEKIAGKYASKELPSYQDLFGKTAIEVASMQPEYDTYVARQAAAALFCGPVIEKQLKEESMRDLYEKIEMPVVFDLCRMEQTGIGVMKEALKKYGDDLTGEINTLQEEICALAGKEFNILSPKQLGEVLFEDLKLPGAKKTKSGYSTSADVLEKLADEYPIVEKVLSYRQLTKLKSTYAEGLAACIAPDGRIHGTFNQTITATGRISSTEPNLQNIPVRMELGRAIRKVFVPKEGCVFVDADYSQIELRVLAHMSGDEGLIDAYRSAQDIHALTASQVFHVPLDQVTPQLRRNAKAVNFGIVYGISAFGLSEDLSISRKEAMEYIEHYFKAYPGIKEFLDRMVDEGRTNEYVTTMFGRRRPIPELKSSNFMQRQFGERIAMNSPIQGTAADIMKIAMTRVNKRLKKEQLKSRIVLQVHDELLVEAPKEECETIKTLLREEMQSAADLRVPLEVSVSEGQSWYETK